MRLLQFLVLLLALLAAGSAAAQEADCVSPQTQTEMTICAGKDYHKADADLNGVWKEAIAMARENDMLGVTDDGKPGYEETLRAAQRAWIKFRDASCDYEGFQARGGTMEPMLVAMCLARLTEERTKQLRDQIQTMGTQ